MIVDQIDLTGIAILEPKHYAPVRPDSNTPESLQFSFKWMQGKAGKVHAFRSLGAVQNAENIFDLLNVIGGDAFGFAISKQAFEALVLEASNRVVIVLLASFLLCLLLVVLLLLV